MYMSAYAATRRTTFLKCALLQPTLTFKSGAEKTCRALERTENNTLTVFRSLSIFLNALIAVNARAVATTFIEHCFKPSPRRSELPKGLPSTIHMERIYKACTVILTLSRKMKVQQWSHKIETEAP